MTIPIFKTTIAILAILLGISSASASSTITLGQIGPFTVFPGPDAIEVNQGIKAYLAQANRLGVHGQKVGFFEADDRYNAATFEGELGKAMDRRPLALLSPIGSNAMKQVLDGKLLDSNDVVIVGVIPGAESFRTPGHPHLFHVRAGDRQQIQKIVRHCQSVGIKRLGVVYQDLAIGTSGTTVAQQEGQQIGIEVKAAMSAADGASLLAAGDKMMSQDAQGILVLGSPKFMAEGVAALRKAGYTRQLFVLSYVPVPLLIRTAGLDGARGVGISQTYPNPNGRTLPLVREFQAAMKASMPQLTEYTAFQLEGYLSARITVEALSRSGEKDLTPAALARSLRSMGRLDLGGFRIDFSKSNMGSDFVDIAVVGHRGQLIY